jgi:hypothetical protein
LTGSETHHLSRQDDDGVDVEWMAPPNIAGRLPQEIDVLDVKTQAALSQIGREEKAAAADEVSPIVRRRASVAQQKVMGFATLNPSYGLRSTHPTGFIRSLRRRGQATEVEW